MSNKNIEISYTLDDFSGDYDAIIPVHRNLHKYRRLINSDLYYGGGHLQCGEIVLYPEEDKPYKRWCFVKACSTLSSYIEDAVDIAEETIKAEIIHQNEFYNESFMEDNGIEDEGDLDDNEDYEAYHCMTYNEPNNAREIAVEAVKECFNSELWHHCGCA